MQGRVPLDAAFGRVTQDDESTSASCADDAPHVHEPARARFARRAAVVVAAMGTMAAMVLGVVTVAGPEPPRGIAAASVNKVTVLQSEWKSNCSSVDESCAKTRCCADPSRHCYEKDAHWAGCLTQCTVGIFEWDPPEYQTPWSCTVLDADADAPDPVEPTTTTDEPISGEEEEEEEEGKKVSVPLIGNSSPDPIEPTTTTEELISGT